MKRCVAFALALMLLCLNGLAEGTAWRYPSQYESVAELRQAGAELVRQVEGEGIVLLKNEGNLLPLPAGSQVSLLGLTALDPVYGGTGSGAVDTADAPNYADVLAGVGYELIDQPLLDFYAEADKRTGNDMAEPKWTKVRRASRDEAGEMTIGRGEHVIFVVGRVGGEGNDLTREINGAWEGDYLTLNEAERSILMGLAEMKDSGDIASITVIINSANPISAGFISDPAYGVDAALWVGAVGQTGLWAVGDVLTGAVNPSGCLPDTWWVDNRADPVMNNFTPQIYDRAAEFFPDGSYYPYTRYVVYQEGIYVGYRYTETRYADVQTGREGAGEFDYDAVVAFPFGFGLSYTDFALTDMQVERTEDGRLSSYHVAVTVQNTGDRAGKKTVQVYAQKPYTEYDVENGIEKAAVELVGYAKTALLQPGETQRLTIDIPEYYLTSYDAENSEAFILTEGVYSLICAENAHDAAIRLIAACETPVDTMAVSTADPLVWCISQAYDDETYSDAFGTGEMVSSLFAFADINRYDGAEDNETTYYSRSDWEGTVTEGAVSLTMTELMAMDLMLTADDLPQDDEFPTLGAENGLMLIDLLDLAADDAQWKRFMDQLTLEELEAICLTGLRETAEVVRIGKPRTLDHNGPTGVTQRYNSNPDGNGLAVVTGDPDGDAQGTCYPCNGILAATFNDTLIERVGEMVGEDAVWAGYSGIYGTGLNLHRSPYSGRVFEYFSEDPLLTGLMGAAWSRGVQSRGVYVYSKHLVLNEQEDNRAGLGTWCNEQALRELYLRAFELPIVYADAKCVMSAFNRLGAIWCGASSELLTDWLRGEAGLSGFVVTDMYDASYMVMVHAIVAGNDIPDGELLPAGDSLRVYGEDGETPNAAVVQAMRESAQRVLYTVLHSRGMDGCQE